VSSTLVYISKALQLIFRFSDAEDLKLVNVNSFMKKKHHIAKEYLKQLIDVPEADIYLQVNRYNKLTGIQIPSIVIGVREIVLLHSLVIENKEQVITSKDDHINIILEDLGAVPQIDPDDTKEIQLELLNRFEEEIKEEQKEKDYKKKILEETLGILERIPIPPGKTFLEILVKAKLFAEKDGKTQIAEEIAALLKSLKKLEEKELIPRGDGYSSFLKEIYLEAEDLKIRVEEQKKEILRLQTALGEIEDQKVFMDNKIEAYENYLATIRRDAETKFKEKSKKLTYKELVKNKILAEVDIDEAILKKMSFTIKQTQMDKFEIKGKVKTGPISLGESIKLDLEDLLLAKENAQTTFDIGSGLVLSVRPTLLYLNQHFFKD